MTIHGRAVCRSAATAALALLCAATQFGCTREPNARGLLGPGANVGGAPASPLAPAVARRAAFAGEPRSPEAAHIADWAVASADHAGLPFAVVDKREAKIFVFDAQGRLSGAAPVLLGAARGDESVPGIGERALADIRPEERTTPAGRFVAEIGRNLEGEDIVWLDYAAAVSMHRVRATKPAEHRLQRLASAPSLDNRISYGCINLPATFYDEVLRPAIAATKVVVYVLPETRSAQALFGSYDVGVGGQPRIVGLTAGSR